MLCTLHLDLHISKFKNGMNCLILQNVPEPPSTTVLNSTLFLNTFWVTSWKQRNGLLGNKVCYVRIYCICAIRKQRFDKLICLFFKFWHSNPFWTQKQCSFLTSAAAQTKNFYDIHTFCYCCCWNRKYAKRCEKVVSWNMNRVIYKNRSLES